MSDRSLEVLLLRVHGLGDGASLLFFGFSSFFFGYLIYRSGYLPKMLGNARQGPV
jgi:hypothetical protein